MTSKCSRCGKRFPMEHLSFLPKAETHIRHMAIGGPDADVSGVDMHKLYCADCLKQIQSECK